MQCARCTGMSIPEVVVEGGARILAMRCIHCGDVIDRIILSDDLHGPSVRASANLEEPLHR